LADKIGGMARNTEVLSNQNPLSSGSPPAVFHQQFMDIPPGLEEFIPGYLASRREEVPEMTRLLADSDFESLAVLGHNLKGSGASFGFPEISRIGVALEQSAEQADHAASGIQLMELTDYLDQVAYYGQANSDQPEEEAG
jgi:HPt (histidine-containing phosphotransfer) domain-containing protein